MVGVPRDTVVSMVIFATGASTSAIRTRVEWCSSSASLMRSFPTCARLSGSVSRSSMISPLSDDLVDGNASSAPGC